MNEWPELGNGEGATNDRFWVIVLKNSGGLGGEPSPRNYRLLSDW